MIRLKLGGPAEKWQEKKGGREDSPANSPSGYLFSGGYIYAMDSDELLAPVRSGYVTNLRCLHLAMD